MAKRDGPGDSRSDDASGSEELQRKRHKRSSPERKGDAKRDDDRRKRHKKSSKKKKERSRKSSSSRRKEKRKRDRKQHDRSSDSSQSSDDSSDSDASPKRGGKKTKVLNTKLLAKLEARGETLEERQERRTQKRAAKIQSRFGYTAEENPFNDPNLHETFTWGKKKDKDKQKGTDVNQNPDTLEEIDSIRQRRKDRDAERDEMERLRAEESRMKELENYDEWAKKEEEFHLEQQRKRSAIRLVEGREKPVDVLAKNLLLFGLTEEEKNSRAAVKYKEKYNALDQLEKLEVELDEPQKIVKILKLTELQELLVDVDAFRMLEKEVMQGESKNSILLYWDALHVVAKEETKHLQKGGDSSPYARKVKGINEIFVGQTKPALVKMGEEIQRKLFKNTKYDADGSDFDRDYWLSVQDQLSVHMAKLDLSELHSKMLVRQLEKLELRKEELAEKQLDSDQKQKDDAEEKGTAVALPENVAPDFGNLEEELGLTDEVEHNEQRSYAWQERYAPRKPRYFNRVKTGFDWNKYNQTHFDSDNPPPKLVQGYKFNIFYPELVDPSKAPQFRLERADTDEFCILRFSAGAPYEDLAFKIINREWNRSRKRGYRCTFERGVLSLYFNFKSHWYRR